METEWKLYTDGGCWGNGMPQSKGAWAFWLQAGEEGFRRKGRRDIVCGHPATNNLMEFTAAIHGLTKVMPGQSVELFTDSMVLVHWINAINRGRTIKGSKMIPEITEGLRMLVQDRKVTVQWIKGHADHPENTWCDEACQEMLAQS